MKDCVIDIVVGGPLGGQRSVWATIIKDGKEIPLMEWMPQDKSAVEYDDFMREVDKNMPNDPDFWKTVKHTAIISLREKQKFDDAVDDFF